MNFRQVLDPTMDTTRNRNKVKINTKISVKIRLKVDFYPLSVVPCQLDDF